MADDVDGKMLLHRPGKELDDSREGLRLRHARAVDVALKLSPVAFSSASAEEVAHIIFANRRCGGNQAALDRDLMEQLIVANDGVIEINADYHGSLHLQLLHPFDIGIQRVGERIF